MPDEVPDGLSLEYAHTTVNLGTPGAAGASSGLAFTLIEREPTGRFVADLGLSRTSDLAQFEVDRPHMPGFAPDDAVGRLDSVRGVPGRVLREINRGDTWGWSEARWIEDGTGWIASSRALDVAALAAALQPLRLNREGVEDPQGRFEVIGRRAILASEDLRDTEIGIGPTGSPSPSTPPVKVNITPVADESAGLLNLSGIADVPPTFQVDAHVSEVDGRLLLSNGTTTLTSLEDGTNVRVQVVGGPSAVGLTDEDVIGLIDGLHRVDGEDPFAGPLVPAWWTPSEPGGVPDGFCHEAHA